MYGGGTFEIKSCSFWYPGGIYLQYRSYKWRTEALQTFYGRATDAYIPSTLPHRTKIVRFQMSYAGDNLRKNAIFETKTACYAFVYVYKELLLGE